MHYDTGWYSAGCKETIVVDKAMFWSTVSEMNLQESRILLSEISTPSLTFYIPFFIIKGKFWQCYPQNFQTQLSAVTFFFSNL